jgi:hypothetical protein
VDDEEQEQVFLDTVKSMATKYGIYIAVTYDLLGPVQKNKLVLIDKNGDIGIDYNKAFPVPGVVCL